MRAFVIVLVLLAGCATRYQGPTDSEPQATLRIVWVPIPELHYGGYQTYSILDNECQPAREGRQMAVVATTPGVDKVLSVRVHAGKEHFIYARGTGSTLAAVGSCPGAAVCIAHPECVNISAVTFERGKSYEIKQVNSGGSCTTLLTEAGSNQPPLSFRRIAVAGLECRRDKK